MAVEPQPDSGTLAGAATGPAGRAIETTPAAKAALSNAPGISAGRRPPCKRVAIPHNLQRLMSRAARPAKRPRRMGLCGEVADGGENLEDRPRPPEQIRLP